MRFIYTRAFGIFLICLVAVTLLVFFDAKGWLTTWKKIFLLVPRPIVYVFAHATQPVKGFVYTVYHLRGISQENVKLSQEVLQLQQNLVQLNQYSLENEALKKELGFVSTSKLSLAACTVLAVNPMGLSDTMVLDCGSDNGIKAGQAVLSQGYLVGKVIYTNPKISTAILITNSSFSTDAKLSESGVAAIARGSFGSGIFLDQLPQNTSLSPGMLVVTAGIDPNIPSNMLIGKIGAVLSSSNDLFKKATILSPIDLNSIGFVSVVK